MFCNLQFQQLDGNNNFNSFMDTIDQNQTDFVSRDDVLIFNDVLSGSGYNIKKYKNRKEQLAKRKKAFTTSASHEQVLTLTMQPTEKDYEHHEKIKLNLEKMPIKRISMTAGTTRRKQYESLKTHSKHQFLSKTIDFRQNLATSKPKQRKQNQFTLIQKKFNKGPLKEKYLEVWLNNLLLQACSEEKFDNSLENSALKKYGLDSNSLLSKGLSALNLNRIYRSLFVYSIGFNDLLNQLCRNNMNLRKTIWKVFSILLEYCAQGHFEVMIAEIQRDKIKKIDGLKREIERRQAIIENSEQINQKKNEKIYKQIKVLKGQNADLKAQKVVLLEEFKQTEQAFNHEVALRLKYENRINQIHGVYAQIEQKHERLVHDFYQVNDLMVNYKAKCDRMEKDLVDYRQDSEEKSKQIMNLKQELISNTESLRENEVVKNTGATTNIAYKNRIKDLQKIVEEQKRTLEQENLNKQNIKLLLATEQKAHQKTQNQLKERLQENSRLHATIQQQMEGLGKYMRQDRNLGFMTKQLKAEVVVITRKYEEKHKELRIKIKEIEELQKEKEKVNAQLAGQKKYNEQLKVDLDVCYQKIEDMKAAKNKLEEEYDAKKKQMMIVDELIDTKNKELSTTKQSNQMLVEKNSELNRQVKTLTSKVHMMKEKFDSTQEIYLNKMKVLKQEKEAIQTEWAHYENIKKSMQQELQKYKSLYNDTNVSFKNQLFERSNLQMRYEQSLVVMEQQNNHIKELNIKISELEEGINAHKRKIKNMEFISNEVDKQHKKELAFWEKKVHELTVESGEKKDYIHPMIYEDVAGRYYSILEQFTKLGLKYESAKNTMEKQIKELRMQLKRKESLYELTLGKKEDEFKKNIEKKTNELLYEQQRTVHLKQKAGELEGQLLMYIEGGKSKFTSEKQEKYLNAIKEKSAKIDELLAQVEKAHDANTALRNNYKNYENKLTSLEQSMNSKELEVLKLQKQLKQKQFLMEKAEKEITSKEIQIKELQDNIEQQRKRTESNMMPDSRDSKRRNEKINWKSERRELSGDNKRSDFARKYKGAYVYYNK